MELYYKIGKIENICKNNEIIKKIYLSGNKKLKLNVTSDKYYLIFEDCYTGELTKLNELYFKETSYNIYWSETNSNYIFNSPSIMLSENYNRLFGISDGIHSPDIIKMNREKRLIEIRKHKIDKILRGV